MAIVRWILVLVAALVAIGTILHFAGVRLGGTKPEASVQLYQCPMHPAIVQDHPGECPICGMTLVPKPAGRGQPSGSTGAPDRVPPAGATAAASPAPVPGLAVVDLTPERVQLIGMKTAVVRRQPLGGELKTVGAVEASERGLAQVTTRFSGWIQGLKVSATGERVRRGQVLATIYSPDVLRAQQELLVASGWTSSGGAGPLQSVSIRTGLLGPHDHEAVR